MRTHKCKNCTYYTGTQCHGHGEYWGNCMLLTMTQKEIENKTKCDYIKTEMNDICFDDTNCIIEEYMNWEEKKI